MGDVVTLKSGGPEMTVHQEGSNSEFIACIWFHHQPLVMPFLNNGESKTDPKTVPVWQDMRKATFSTDTLIKVR